MDILEPGGTLIIASECSEGFGSAEFQSAQKKLVELGPERFLATLQAKSFAEIDEWQTEMQMKPMRLGHIQLYTTGLNAEERRITGVEVIESVEKAVQQSMEKHGDSAVAVIPEGRPEAEHRHFFADAASSAPLSDAPDGVALYPSDSGQQCAA
jgi:hypothetical protein